MTAAQYLKQVDEIDARDLGKLLELSRAVVTDKAHLARDDCDMLTALITDKMEQGI